jgi:hypothetical protein
VAGGVRQDLSLGQALRLASAKHRPLDARRVHSERVRNRAAIGIVIGRGLVARYSSSGLRRSMLNEVFLQ